MIEMIVCCVPSRLSQVQLFVTLCLLCPWNSPGKNTGVVENLHYQCRRREFDPWVGKIPWRRKWQPTPVFLTGEPHVQRSLVGYSPWGCKELDSTGQLSTQVKQITSGKFHITQESQPGPL